MPIEDWTFPPEAFDLVVSSLALHYLPDVTSVLEGAFRTLAAGGCIAISIEHPVITSRARGWHEGERADWIVDDYFIAGPRITAWLGGRVVRFHRAVETYVAAMQAAGLVVDHLRESRPRPEMFSEEAEFERRRRIPLFLFLAAHKPGPC